MKLLPSFMLLIPVVALAMTDARDASACGGCFVPDEESTTRNLIPRNLVRNWMRDSVERLYALQPQTAYATAADGGVPARDLLSGMPEVGWEKVTRDFFLTAE